MIFIILMTRRVKFSDSNYISLIKDDSLKKSSIKFIPMKECKNENEFFILFSLIIKIIYYIFGFYKRYDKYIYNFNELFEYENIIPIIKNICLNWKNILFCIILCFCFIN